MPAPSAAGPNREAFDWTRASFNDAAARVAASAMDGGDGIDDGLRGMPMPSLGGLRAPGLAASSDRMRKVPLTVRDDELGAGLEISFVPKCGFVIEAVAEIPGQPGLREGDIIMAAGGQSLALDDEEEADEVLASQIVDGVLVTVTQDPAAALDPMAALPRTALAAAPADASAALQGPAQGSQGDVAEHMPGDESLAPDNSAAFFDFDDLEDSAEIATLPVTMLAAAPAEASATHGTSEPAATVTEEEEAVKVAASSTQSTGALETMSVAELRQELIRQGLSADGCLEKSDLVQRIASAIAAAGEATEVVDQASNESQVVDAPIQMPVNAAEVDAAGEALDDASSASEKTMPLCRWLEAEPELNCTRPEVGVAEEALGSDAIGTSKTEARLSPSESTQASIDGQVAEATDESDDVFYVSPDVLKSTLSSTLLTLSSTLGAAGLPPSMELPATETEDTTLESEEEQDNVASCEAAVQDSTADDEAWSHAPPRQSSEEADGESWTWSQESPMVLPLPRTLSGKSGVSSHSHSELVASDSSPASSAVSMPAPPPAKTRLASQRAATTTVQLTDSGLALVSAKEASARELCISKGGNTRSSASAATIQLAPPETTGAESSGMVQCKVHDLWDWMVEMNLQEYFGRATQWCIEMGAAALDEIAENIEDFGEDVALKPIEKQRVQKWASQVLLRSGGGASGSNSWVIEADCPRGGGSSAWALDADVSRGGSANGWAGSSGNGWGGASGWGYEAEAEVDLDVVGCNDPSLASNASYSYQREETASQESVPIYTARSMRLAMDSRGNTGLGLEWDEEWGIRVRSVDPLPGQPGLRAGDFIVAIDGCSLRHRPHEECDSIFAERLQDGACLSVVSTAEQEPSPQWQLATRPAAPTRQSEGSGRAKGFHSGKAAAPLQMRLSRAPRQVDGQHGWSLGKGRRGPALSRGGYDANVMWRRFRGPPW